VPTRSALVAPDSFKGTFSAPEVGGAVAAGVRAADVAVVELPLGDGGEGTLDVLVEALGGEYRTAMVDDPLGRSRVAQYGLLPDGRGVVEMAQASGLGVVAEAERNAWAATTRGTGQLIVAAAEAGATPIIVTVGGSATTDGGGGALEVLDEAGLEPELEVVCDVTTVFEDAPRVFGPQKGADDEMVRRLERRLDKLADSAPRDPRGLPMTGCAGGLSGGLWAFRGASLVPGAAYVLDVIGFDEHVHQADLVLTGEGRLDEQTFAGKAVGEVARRCRGAGVPCHAVVGRSELDPRRAAELGLAGVSQAQTLAQLERVGRELAASAPR
jgi:glycerate kinase